MGTSQKFWRIENIHYNKMLYLYLTHVHSSIYHNMVHEQSKYQSDHEGKISTYEGVKCWMLLSSNIINHKWLQMVLINQKTNLRSITEMKRETTKSSPKTVTVRRRSCRYPLSTDLKTVVSLPTTSCGYPPQFLLMCSEAQVGPTINTP